MTPTISIITPSYNQGQFIERTIQSVLSQDISNLEYVVIDGASTDDTISILKAYGMNLRWTSERDIGQADAVNKGIRRTKGEIIGWLNSDDVYYPGALKKVLLFFEKYPKIDIIYGDADFIDSDNNIIEPYYTEDWDYERLKEKCFVCQPAVFFRRRLIDKFGILDDQLQYCLDYEYWLRVGNFMDFVRVNQKLAGSRLYPENKTLNDRIAVCRETNNMLQSLYGSVAGTWIINYANAVAEKTISYRSHLLKKGIFLCIFGVASLIACLKWTPNFKTKHKKPKAYRWAGVLLIFARIAISFPAALFKKISSSLI